MNFSADSIKSIYEGNVAKRYDRLTSHFFAHFKKKAFENSSIKSGDTVLVYCCGTGLDFPHIRNLIGDTGRIIGIDFSREMLKQASEKVEKYEWDNIELIEGDVVEYSERIAVKADAGVCTLGLSIIPDYLAAYESLLSNVKVGGEILVGDMQLAAGKMAVFNPLVLRMSRRFGGTREGHQNSRLLRAKMMQDLADVQTRAFFFNSYYYCVGKIKA